MFFYLDFTLRADESDNQRTPVVEIGPGYFALPLHHAVSLPLRDLPDESASEEAPVRIRPLHRITLPQPPNPPQPDPAIEGANSGGIEQQSTCPPSTENPVN